MTVPPLPPLPPILPIADPAAVARAAEAIRREALIAYPTDTVYGVGGNALSPEAARRVRTVKGREAGKGFPVLLAAAGDVDRLASEWPAPAAALAERFWPGALTIVVPARAGLPDDVCSGDTIALRVPGLAPLRAVIRAGGVPLIGTSANRSGQPAALTAAAAARALGGSVELVLAGGAVGGQPSTVVAVRGGSVRILRAGAVGESDLAAALAPLGVGLEPFGPT
jgi:L-threonylcarbamoyladenylate synthase